MNEDPEQKQFRGKVRRRQNQMDIQNQPHRPVRAKQDQMDIQNQVHQARRARQIAQRRARQEERQLDIRRLKQQIETIIGSNFTNERDRHVVQLLDNLSRVVSPEQNQQYSLAAYEWKANYLEDEIKKITTTHLWNEQKENQVMVLMNQLDTIVTPERYQDALVYLREWKVNSLEGEINRIIGSDYNQQKENKVEALLKQLKGLDLQRYQKSLVDAQSWKVIYLEGEIKKIIDREWTQQREDRVAALLADMKKIAREQVYKEDKAVVVDWKANYLEGEIVKRIGSDFRSDFNQHKKNQVETLLDQLKKLNIPEDRYTGDLNAANTWKANYLKVKIHKIISSDYNNQKENQVVALLEQLKLREPGRHPHYQNLAIEWKNRPPNPSNLQVVRNIGQGGFGQTDLVRDHTTNKEYIRKKGINTYGNGNQNMQYQYKNLQYLKDKGICNQGFICPVLMYNRYNTVYILMDYLKGYKDIFDILGRLSNHQRVNIGRQAIHLMQTLHQNGIVHCDFKGNNVMYNEREGKVKVIDFGVSVQRKSSDRHTLKIDGHPYTDKPNRNYGQRNGIYTWNQLIRKDYWGLGIFLYMLKYGSITSPFNINNDTSYNRNAQNNELNHFYGTHNIQFFT